MKVDETTLQNILKAYGKNMKPRKNKLEVPKEDAAPGADAGCLQEYPGGMRQPVGGSYGCQGGCDRGHRTWRLQYSRIVNLTETVSGIVKIV